jgi:hypothetical protein
VAPISVTGRCLSAFEVLFHHGDTETQRKRGGELEVAPPTDERQTAGGKGQTANANGPAATASSQ